MGHIICNCSVIQYSGLMNHSAMANLFKIVPVYEEIHEVVLYWLQCSSWGADVGAQYEAETGPAEALSRPQSRAHCSEGESYV